LKKILKNILVLFIIANGIALFSQEENKALLRVDTNTFFIISHQTQLVTPANINLNSSITGKGKLKLYGKNKSNIDAHNQSIENLIIVKSETSNTYIISDIHITNSFKIKSGTLCLSDFSIFLDNGSEIKLGEYAHIQHFGNGRIIQNKLPQLLVNNSNPFQLKQFITTKQESNSFQEYKEICFIENSIRINNFNHKPPTPPA
jgi:hypothetical protein